MAQTYTQLVQSVRDWANRDVEVLSDTIIQQCLRFAADTAYRELRIPPLEHIQQYVVIDDETNIGDLALPSYVDSAVVSGSTSGRNQINLPIPGDLTEFIYIRLVGQYETVADPAPMGETRNPGNIRLDANGDVLVTDTMGIGGYSRAGQVWNEKTDIRTYHDTFAEKYDLNYWVRQQGEMLLNGTIQAGDVFEVYYYRRLAALDACYDVSPVNYVEGLLTVASNQADTSLTQLYFPSGTTAANVMTDLAGPRTLRPTATATATNTVGIRLVGMEVPNWLREENDRIVLFGALHHAFDYLQEEDQSQKYLQKFISSMLELNEEENKRKFSGGNIQVNFNGFGRI